MELIIVFSIEYFGRQNGFCLAMSPVYVPFPVYDYPNIFCFLVSVLQSKTEYDKQKCNWYLYIKIKTVEIQSHVEIVRLKNLPLF